MKSIILSLALVFIFSGSFLAQQETYSFDHEIKAEMTMEGTDVPEGSYDYAFLFPDEGGYVGMIGDMSQAGVTMKTKAVFDINQEYVIALIDQGGMKMGMKMNTNQELPAGTKDNTKEVKTRKTGNTMEMLGYTCIEYESTDGEFYTLIWLTDEIDLPNFYDALSAINRQENNLSQEIPEGFLMMMTAWPNGKDTDEKVVLKVTEVNLNTGNEISTAGYQIMAVPNH